MSALSAGAFGPAIRAAREHSGLTQAELARRADLTAMSVSYIERGINWPLLDTAIALCEALGLSLDGACTPEDAPEKAAERVLAEKGEKR
jgi:transcriptional regulator with XRE-family HTH domain